MAEEWLSIAKAAADARDDLRWCHAELRLLFADSGEDWETSSHAWLAVPQLAVVCKRLASASDALTLGLKNRGKYTTKSSSAVNGNSRKRSAKKTRKVVS